MTTAQFQNLSVSPLALNDNCTVPEPLWMSTCLKWPLLLQVPNDITHSQLLPVFGHPIKSSAKRVSFSHRTWQQYLQQQKIQDRAQDQAYFFYTWSTWLGVRSGPGWAVCIPEYMYITCHLEQWSGSISDRQRVWSDNDAALVFEIDSDCRGKQRSQCLA